jgi:hypothetical protein
MLTAADERDGKRIMNNEQVWVWMKMMFVYLKVVLSRCGEAKQNRDNLNSEYLKRQPRFEPRAIRVQGFDKLLDTARRDWVE